MAWVRAKRNPNSMASLYGDTPTGMLDASIADFGSDLFWQNPDGSFVGVDPRTLREESYWNADGQQGGGNIYTDQFDAVGNPPYWELMAEPYRSQAYANMDPAALQNPQFLAADKAARDKYHELNKAKIGQGPFALFRDFASNPAGMLIGGAALAGIGSGLLGGGTTPGLNPADFASSGVDIPGFTNGQFSFGNTPGVNFDWNNLINFDVTGGSIAGLPGFPSATGAGGGLLEFLQQTVPNFPQTGGPNLPNIPPSPPPGGGGGGTQPPAPVQNGPTNPGTGPGGSQAPLGSASGASSALQRIIDGSATAGDWLSVAGTLGSTALGAFTANRQTDALQDAADKYLAIGAPSRARYEGSFAPGFTMANEPGYRDALESTSDSILRKLSATGGNPYGTPGAMIEANKAINASLALPALQNYRNQNASTGGYSAFNTAAPGAQNAATASSGNALTNIAGGLSDLLNPKPAGLTLDDLRKLIGSSGGGISSGGTSF